MIFIFFHRNLAIFMHNTPAGARRNDNVILISTSIRRNFPTKACWDVLPDQMPRSLASDQAQQYLPISFSRDTLTIDVFSPY